MQFTEQEVLDIFRKYVPDEVNVEFLDKGKFIADSMLNDFIQEQMRIGIYDDINIYSDFLGAAKAYSLFRKIEICLDLINAHCEGVDDALAKAYVHWMAAHEAHHFEDAHMLPARSPLAQAMHEKDCNTIVSERYPELDVVVAEFEKVSPVYQRVYARIAEISRNHEAQN